MDIPNNKKNNEFIYKTREFFIEYLYLIGPENRINFLKKMFSEGLFTFGFNYETAKFCITDEKEFNEKTVFDIDIKDKIIYNIPDPDNCKKNMIPELTAFKKDLTEIIDYIDMCLRSIEESPEGR